MKNYIEARRFFARRRVCGFVHVCSNKWHIISADIGYLIKIMHLLCSQFMCHKSDEAKELTMLWPTNKKKTTRKKSAQNSAGIRYRDCARNVHCEHRKVIIYFDLCGARFCCCWAARFLPLHSSGFISVHPCGLRIEWPQWLVRFSTAKSSTPRARARVCQRALHSNTPSYRIAHAKLKIVQ